jgi:hypothetical protein
MNLNQITARIGELSAELLTLHKDMTFILEGGVFRQLPVGNSTPAPVVGAPVDWRDLNIGDMIRVQTRFKLHGVGYAEPGIYIIDDVEDPEEYDGELPFSITGNSLDGHWVYCESPEESENNDYHERGNVGTNAYGLFRKVI